MARRKSHERSMGTMISTVCFFIMAVFFFLQSADFLDAGHTLKGYGLDCMCHCQHGSRAEIYNSQYYRQI